jgi:hypothetical protein
MSNDAKQFAEQIAAEPGSTADVFVRSECLADPVFAVRA